MKLVKTVETIKNQTRLNQLVSSTLRKLAIGLGAAGLALSTSAQLSALPVHADNLVVGGDSLFGSGTASSIGTIYAAADCYPNDHKIVMGGFINVSDRLPAGAVIYSQYAYWHVDAGGNALVDSTGQVNYVYSKWQSSTAPATISVPDYSGQGQVAYTTRPPLDLPGWTDWETSGYSKVDWNASATWKVAVRAAYWNGSSWEYTGWDTATLYRFYWSGEPALRTPLCYGSWGF